MIVYKFTYFLRIQYDPTFIAVCIDLFRKSAENKRQNTDIRMQSATGKLETLLYDVSWCIKKHETQNRSLKY